MRIHGLDSAAPSPPPARRFARASQRCAIKPVDGREGNAELENGTVRGCRVPSTDGTEFQRDKEEICEPVYEAFTRVRGKERSSRRVRHFATLVARAKRTLRECISSLSEPPRKSTPANASVKSRTKADWEDNISISLNRKLNPTQGLPVRVARYIGNKLAWLRAIYSEVVGTLSRS